MIDGLPLAPFLNGVGVVGVMLIFGFLVITDRLVWHKRLQAAENRADRWESVALQLLGVTEKLTVQAEVTNQVLTSLPVPAGKTRT